MKVRQLTALALLVLLPLGVAISLGLNSLDRSESERMVIRRELLTGRLERLAQQGRLLEQVWSTRLRNLAATLPDNLNRSTLTEVPTSPGGQAWLQRISLDEPLLRQVFILDNQGSLVWPNSADASSQERAFLDRSLTFLSGNWLPPREEAGTWSADGGWYRWYWQDGLQLLYWLPRNGGFLCFDLNRSALLAELAASLSSPLGNDDPPTTNLVQVLDEQGHSFLQWGAWTAPGQITAQVALDGVLDGWQLVWLQDPTSFHEDQGADLALVLSLVALCLVAIMLAAYFLRGWRRDLREAGQRVSFVNQVSHELKTPLTNIRLYAELLESQLEPRQTQALEYAAIIEREGRRLGRLIHNVLSFGRHERNGAADAIHPRPGIPDEVVQSCLESFAISFQEKQLRLETGLDCPGSQVFDPDALDQILGNLLSNAEKYARSGKAVRVVTRSLPDGFELEVRDWGPGLPPGAEKRVFTAFERFSTKLTDGVSGTGLGLYLVRQLARQHGGDAWYHDAKPGASFTVSLKAPPSAIQPPGGSVVEGPAAPRE